MKPPCGEEIEIEETRREIELKLEIFLQTKARYHVSAHFILEKNDLLESFEYFIVIDNYFFDFVEYETEKITNKDELITVCMIELLYKYNQISEEKYVQLFDMFRVRV